MSDLSLYLKISLLPNSLKSEINDFIDFLREKKLKNEGSSMKHPKAGCMKGTFKLSSDFDKPLDDFKEYMY
jgi:hypothetical protein